MTPRNDEFDPLLDKAISEIRSETLDDAAVEQAAQRVWSRLETAQHAPLRSCADFQALMPDYRAGKLSEARALLLKDHTRDCIACRKVLSGPSARPVVVSSQPRRSVLRPVVSSPYFRWAIAAALVIGVSVSAWNLWNHYGPLPAGHATVLAMGGMLYHVSDQGSQPLAAGQELAPGAEVRTAKDSFAVVKLRDGSLVEMRERSALAMSETRRDVTIQLGLGSIIVQAAKRRSGHLFVATRDCKVAVTGTVFSVNSGIKGSRVSVIEGEVHVDQAGREQVLHPGDQVATNLSLSPVPVQDEIAWSRDLDKHLALLREVSALQKSLEQVHFPDLRYSSRLLNLLPPDTAVYAAIPNLGPTLSEAHQVLREKVQQSPVLREWWAEKMDARHGVNLDEVVANVRAFSDYLGDEIVIAARLLPSGRLGDPVFLAELKRPGFREFVDSMMGKAGVNAKLPMLIRGNLVVLGHSDAALAQMALDGQGGFASTPFGARVAEAYRQGAGLLFSADLEKITAMQAPALANGGMQYLLVEQKESGGRADTRAVLSFRGQRTGIAAWLARPAPMGSLDFITPDAAFVTAFAIRNPALVMDELLTNHPDALRGLSTAESQLGVNLRNDLFAPLGGEFAIALDGPALPVPSWKLAVEVYDPARLQWTIQKLVEAFNHEAGVSGKPVVQLTQEAVNGRVFYTMVIPEARPFSEAHYTFADGYLLAAPSRALIERALQTHASGYSLPRSAAFTALVPRDPYSNFSAMVYQNLGPTLGPLAGLLSGFAGALKPEQQQAVQGLTDQMKPTLITLYGDADRITLASNGSLFGLSVNNLLGLPGTPLGFGPLLGNRARGTRHPGAAYHDR